MCITENCWSLFCLFVSCMPFFLFQLFTCVSTYLLCFIFKFLLPAAFWTVRQCSPMLYKDREVSFLPIINLYLSSLTLLLIIAFNFTCLVLVMKSSPCYSQHLARTVTGSVALKGSVAVTDLFSLANQCPLLSNSATHWPISEQSALIPSSSQELFFLAFFGSHPAEQRALSQQWRKTSLSLSLVLFYRHPSMEDLHWR